MHFLSHHVNGRTDTSKLHHSTESSYIMQDGQRVERGEGESLCRAMTENP